MLEANKKQALDKLLAELDRSQIAWVNGYLSGLLASSNVIPAKAGIQAKGEKELDPRFHGDDKKGDWDDKKGGGDDEKILVDNLSIIYVTETGNSKFLASEIAKKLKNAGTNVKIKSSDQYRVNDLAKEKNLILIISTHGDGELPLSGKKLDEYLQTNPDLSSLNYFVIALGDTNYPLFCKAGKDVDLALEKLKAKRLAPVTELDLNFEQEINAVYEQVLNAFQTGGNKNSKIAPVIKTVQSNYEGEILTNINLNDIDSTKETRHIEIAVEGEIHYEPGDSIGILLDGKQFGVEEKLTPRLYSIASSVHEHNGEVHLTVSVLRYVDENGKQVNGLFSNYLANLKVGEKIKFYVSKNRQFKLPDDNKDVIMVGPGTGVAPFRSFVAERNYRLASGKNWLFFGERNFSSDFLYQTEWQDYLESGLLSKLDVAFSRDTDQKIYVQNRIKENSKEVYQWLENGAYFYICGDKDNMAKDVENTLLEVIAIEGEKTSKEAQNYLDNLKEQNRYLKDVY